MFKSMGVMGLLLIIIAWRCGDIELGVGILVMFSLVYMDLGTITSTPPLARTDPVHRLCLCVIVLELLYMIL